jgi:uncharacterized protein YjbI with pentapeptide repeats
MSDISQEIGSLTDSFRRSLGPPAGGPGRSSVNGAQTLRAKLADLEAYFQEVAALLKGMVSAGKSLPTDLYIDLTQVFIEEAPPFPDLICGIRLDGAVVAGALRLEGAKVVGQVHVGNAVFRGGAVFDGSTFHEPMNLGSAHFGNKTPQAARDTVLSLRACKFKKAAVFSSDMYGTVDLSNAEFGSSLTLAGLLAEGAHLLMRDAIVEGPFLLSATGKSLLVAGDRSIFKGRADFAKGGTRRFGPVVFDSAEFRDDVSFQGANLADAASFKGAKFKNIDMSNISTSAVPLDFSGATIRGVLDIRRATLPSGPNFSKTTFFRCPRVGTETLPYDTRMRSATFRGFSSEDDLQGYRALKRAFALHHAREEENLFFACEQRARRKLDFKDWKRWFQVFLSTLYDWGSGYGQSVGKPLVLLTLLTVGACVGYAMTCGQEIAPTFRDTWAEDLPSGLGLALQSVLNPLALFSGRAPFRPSSGLVALAAGIQSFASLLLAALAVLAIRRRFRKETD